MQLHLLNGAVTQDKQHYNEERNYLPHGLDEKLHDRYRHCHPEPVAQQLVEETACQRSKPQQSYKIDSFGEGVVFINS